MAKEFYIRTMTAGRYTKTVRYSRTLPGDSKSTRNAKQAATAAAQKYINVKNATEKLQLLLCANFDSKNACFCTFTFQEDNQPANAKHTQRIFADYLKKLRPEFQRQGRSMKYIYTVEGKPLAVAPEAFCVDSQQWEIAPWRDRERWAEMDDVAAQEESETATRLHVHCFLLLEKGDYEAVKALWPYGQVYISQMKVNELTTFQRLASYVTKEKREGEKGNGVRSYIPSVDLDKPVITGHWCSEYEGIMLPYGAEEIKSGSERDEIYGTSMEYIFYRMPRPQQTPQPYKGKGQLRQGRRRLTRK